jgi:signal transduction histidine kinase
MTDRTRPPPTAANEPARQIQQLSRLVELSQALACQLDLEPLLQQIVDTARELLNADLGSLLVLGEHGQGVRFFKVSGWTPEPGCFPSWAGIHSLPCREGVSLRLEDARSHPPNVDFPPDHPRIGPLLAAPLERNHQVLGALFIGNAPGGPYFSADDEELLTAFAAQAAIAIENARLYAQTEELARLRERQRIAQALHDTLAQMLFTIGLEARWCIEHLALEAEARRRLQTILRLAARGGDELRSAIFALRGPYLPGDDGLIELLGEQVEEFKVRSGVIATLIVPPGFPSLPPLVGEAVYRIVCESLSNVHKHSHASAVVVSLYCDANAVSVTVQDNGVGLTEPLPLEREDHDLHFGVATMRQVAARAHGDLRIANSDDQGVVVRARFPLPGARGL